MKPTRDKSAPDADRSWLSAAMDGDGDALARGAKAWRDDASSRATWHAYHLIGDTLRSSELARPATHDAAFLNALRQRLAREPVVLAPQAETARRPAGRWVVPAAVAAGFVVVAGVLVVARTGGPVGTAADVMAGASSPAGLVNVSNATVLRDPRVDELLRVHQATRGGMAVPGSALRRVDNVVVQEAPR